ncbi:uncharacterized protein ACIBXB_007681 isoform 1-T1 [Morphnus guianensis]
MRTGAFSELSLLSPIDQNSALQLGGRACAVRGSSMAAPRAGGPSGSGWAPVTRGSSFTTRRVIYKAETALRMRLSVPPMGMLLTAPASGLRGLSLPGLALLLAWEQKGTGGALTGCGQELLRLKLERPEKDLSNWKAAAGNYRVDPEKVANAFEMMVKMQNPDWQDVEAILQVVFDGTEKDMVHRAMRTQIQAQLASGTLQGQVENHFPSADPGWDPNDPRDRWMLARYQKWVLFGIQNAMLKAINWSKLYEIKQDRKELPTDFFE